MHGSQMGSLRVYARVGSMEQLMFEHSSDRGDTWEGHQINIETAAQFQVSVSRGFFEWRISLTYQPVSNPVLFILL